MHPEIYIIGLFVSGTILLISLRNYWRKSWINVSGSFSIASSINCDDRYVSHISLENQKDRVVNIFAIYLQVGHAYYISLESFKNEPLVLKPYETYRKELGPIEFYAVNTKKVNFDPLLENDRARKRIVLSTSRGRYIVKSRIKHWDPIIYFFQNHLAAVVRPIPSKYKGMYLGSNIKFVVELKFEDGKEEVIAIHPNDYRYKRFRSFQLTQESLESKLALETFLRANQAQRKLNVKTIKVFDVDTWREESNDFYKGEKIDVKDRGFFYFHIVGRSLTWLSNRRMRKMNLKARNNVT